MTAHAFQVDLRGVVDLLSHHLYSSPRVYVRELLQNAVDALTMRAAEDPDAPRTVTVVPADRSDDGRVLVQDTGIGLTHDEVGRFLATIGSSAKRDDLGFSRHDYLGQFGIGLLSCFLVTDDVDVVSRSARGGAPVHWRGSSDGSYTLETLPDDADVPVGTQVRLAPRRGEEHWLTTRTVTELVTTFASLLDVPVTVRQESGEDRLLTQATPPWVLAAGPDPERAAAWCERELGFAPLDTIPLEVPEVGLRGVAYVLSHAAPPASQGSARVHLKGMLLGEQVTGLVPEWAFFARCVVDVRELRPTASRESLYADDALATARAAIGGQLRAWLVRMSVADPRRLRRFLEVHTLGVKAMAVHDDELLTAVLPFLEFETTTGPATLPEVARVHGRVRYTATVSDFRQVAAVAAAQGIGVVNGGYVHDVDLLERVRRVAPEVVVERIDPLDLGSHVGAVDPDVELAAQPFLQVARRTMLDLGCDLLLRSFEPAALASLYLVDRDARHRAALWEAVEELGDLWSSVLSAVEDTTTRRPQLVLNHRNPVVARLVACGDPGVQRAAVESLYAQALMLGQHDLGPAGTTVVNRASLALIEHAVAAARPPQDPA